MSDVENDNRFLGDMYPSALIGGKRVTRSESLPLDQFWLDANTAEFLGCENIGVLVENCGELAKVKRKLEFLDVSPGIGKWIAVMGTRARLWVIYNQWHGLEGDAMVSESEVPPFWAGNKVVFTTPEGLKKLIRIVNDERSLISGVLLVDLECSIYKLRGNEQMRNDRPQYIVDFRASLTRMGWAPPLIIMTQKLARSVETESLRIAFSLESLWFVDGTRISFRPNVNP